MDAARVTADVATSKATPGPAAPVVESRAAPVAPARAPAQGPEAAPGPGYEAAREEAHEAAPEPAGTVLVDEPLAPGDGQVGRGAFMAELRARLDALCDEELASIGRTAADCPYLRAWLDYYDGRSAAQIERAIRAYTGGAPAADPAALFDAVTARVRSAVRIWVATGKVTGVPEGVSAGTPALQRKPADGAAGPRRGVDPASVRASLGTGAAMDSDTRSRMERGFGHSFGDVHVHTDATASGLASSLSARAFTVGSEIAFGEGQYRPGTIEGDLLLAHELSHTIQQSEGVAAAASPGPGLEDSSLEREADRGALFAVAPLWGLDVPFLSAKVGELRAPKGRTGLSLQGCATEVKTPEPALGTVPDYDAFSDPSGHVNTPEREQACAAMVRNPDQLDQVFFDAQPQRNNPRAQFVWRLLEVNFDAIGKSVADQVNAPECMLPGYQELGGPCTPNWSVLSYLSETRPAGARLLEIVALAYSKRARELQFRNEIIINALNLLLAGWAARAALAGEARALNVEAPKAPPLPERVMIPPEYQALDGAAAAEAMGLKSPPAGYRWVKTRSGGLAVARPRNRPDLPKLRYDPATQEFVPESAYVKPKDLIKPSIPPAELEDAANKALAARDAITTIPEGKTVARSPEGVQTTSGWGPDPKSLDPVRELSSRIGHEPQPNVHFDKAGPGSYNLSHAEKQLAAMAPGAPIGVSRVMCMDCQIFFKKLANNLGKPVVVADPAGVRVFLPDGRVLSAPTARELVGAAALQSDIEEEDQ